LGELLAKIHQMNSTQSVGFNYSNYLVDRVKILGEPFAPEFSEILDRGMAAFASLESLGEYVCHSDLTMRNVVIDTADSWWPIDNEHLGIGYWVLGIGYWATVDLLNATRTFSHNSKMLRSFFGAYSESGGDLKSFLENSDALSDIWKLRITGSLLQTYDENFLSFELRNTEVNYQRWNHDRVKSCYSATERNLYQSS
jgi:hypothetical protein